MFRKHIIFLVLLGILFTVPAYSQLKIGLKGGLSTTQLDAEDFNVTRPGGLDDLEVAFKEAKYGIHGGIVIRAQFNNFLFQPEVLFNSSTTEYDVTNLSSQITEIKEEKFQYVDIPVLLGYKFGPLRLMAGPEGHIFIDSASDLFDFQDYDQKFDNLTLSWLAGAGLDIWNLMLDVRYEGNFKKYGDHIRFGDQQFDFADTPSRWTFSVGFLFGR
ncbi:MAG: PorT family protein [Saprospiraceae bacterium]|nr:PorT family protein [Saprospiraceae bacterium]